MSMLDRKLWRDLATLRGQVISIALVVAAGISVFVASISTYDSLLDGRDRFYSETRFPQIFVSLKRAPLAIVPRLQQISGVATVEPRIVRDVIVDWPAAQLPVSARIVSLTHSGEEPLAKLHLRSGTAPQPNDSRSVAINAAFADANKVPLGGELQVLLNGRPQSFRISATALSPEYVYAVKSGVPIPDDRFFAVLWLDRSAAEAAFDMKGAFNDLVVSLAPAGNAEAVIDEGRGISTQRCDRTPGRRTERADRSFEGAWLSDDSPGRSLSEGRHRYRSAGFCSGCSRRLGLRARDDC